MRVLRAVYRFLLRNEGQDLAEYCLITAFVALLAAGILFKVSGGMQNLWSIGNSHLNAGAAAAGGSSNGTGSSVPGH